MNKHFSQILLSLLLALSAFPQQCQAWCALAHFLLTRDAHGEAIAQYANLPDAWEANSPMDWGGTIAISQYFCWSHAVKDKGVLDLKNSIFEIPIIPEYISDYVNNQPGAVMTSMLANKINLAKHWHSNASAIQAHLGNACLGFTEHNLQDKPVHWEFFEGATGTETNKKEAQDKWTIHHGLKECWVEYVLLATKVLKKTTLERTDFDDQGHLKFPANVTPPQLAIDGLNDNDYDNDKINSLAWLLHLAQAAYNKNRTRRSAKNDSPSGLELQSVREIKKLLAKQDKCLRAYFQQSHWAQWELKPEFGLCQNFQEGTMELTGLNGDKETRDFDTPENLYTEWQMLKHLNDNFYKNTWAIDTLPLINAQQGTSTVTN